MSTFATRIREGRRIGWTVAADVHQRCDGCGGTSDVGGTIVILHVGRCGERPVCPLAALCRRCLVSALDEDTARWDDETKVP